MNAEQLNKLDTTLSNTERTALATEEVLAAIQGGGEGADTAVAISRHNTDPDAHQDFRTFSGGTPGLVPAAAAGEETKVLTGGGTWATVATSAEVEAAQGVADAALAKAERANGGGAAVISLTEDKVMTATDPRNLLVTADMPGRSITLPDAATIEADGIAFRIQVEGDYDVTVKDAQGRPVGANSGKVAVGGTRMFLLMDKASGLWRWADWRGGESGSAGAGDTVVPGTKYVLRTHAANDVHVALLSDTKAIVVFRDEGNSGYGTAIILNISEENIIAGNSYVFNESSTSDIAIAIISESKAIVVFAEPGNSNKEASCILNISGESIIKGNKTVFNNAGGNHCIHMLSESKALLTFIDSENSSATTVCILSISGDNINVVKKFTNNAKASKSCSTLLSETKAIIIFSDLDNLSRLTACVVNISGDNITIGERFIVIENGVAALSISSISETKAIVAFCNLRNSSYGECCVLDVSGETIVVGAKCTFNDYETSPTSISSLSEYKTIVAFQDKNGQFMGKTCILNTNIDTIIPKRIESFNRSQTESMGLVKIHKNKCIVAFRDEGNSGYLTGCILTIV